jgi:hypothetical protein
MPKEYFGCWNRTFGDLRNTETASEQTCGSNEQCAWRPIEKNSWAQPRARSPSWPCGRADAVLAVLVFLDLLKGHPDGFAKLFLTHANGQSAAAQGGDRHAGQWDRPWRFPPIRNHRLSRRRALHYNGLGAAMKETVRFAQFRAGGLLAPGPVLAVLLLHAGGRARNPPAFLSRSRQSPPRERRR